MRDWMESGKEAENENDDMPPITDAIVECSVL